MIGFGGVIKFIIEFNDGFWKDILQKNGMANMSFIFSDAHVPTWWSQLPNETPVITGWLGGPVTRTLSETNDQLFQMALTSLQYLLKCPTGELKKNITHWHVAHWVNDPFSLGAYSYPTVKTKAALQIVGQPVGGVLHFAGEAFYEGPSMGTVEAALASGRDIAKRILDSFKESASSKISL
jgi:monoamine oxidase